MSKRRVVVTGLGAITSLGTLDDFWKGLLAGRSGIQKIHTFDVETERLPGFGGL